MFSQLKWQNLCVLFIFFSFWVSVSAEENRIAFPKQFKDTLMALYNTDHIRIGKLKKGILAAYRSQGETGVRNFINKRRNDINLPLIVEIADSGFNEKNEQWLRITMILTEEKKKQKAVETWLAMTTVYSTNISTNCSEYILYDSLHIFAQMGMCIFIQSREKGFECLEKLIPLIEEIKHPFAQDVLIILKTAIYALKNDFNKMEKVFDKELLSMKETESLQQQGQIFLAKGAIHLNKGEYIKVFEMLEKALKFFEKAGDVYGQGYVYMLRGTLYKFIGYNIRALDMFDKALLFLEKAGSLPGQCSVYRSKAVIYQNIGENLKAIEMYDKAFHCFEITKNNREKAYIYMAKGHIYYKAGDRLDARNMYNHALVLLGNEQDAVERKNLYMAMGVIDFISGDWSHAIEMYEKAVPLYSEFGHIEGKGHLYKTLGEINFLTGNYSKAGAMYDKAFQEYQKTGTSQPLSHTLHRKAQVLAKMGKKDKALVFFEEAIGKLEKSRKQAAFSWMKMAFMETFYEQYQETVLFMLENQYHKRAFQYGGSMKARVFLDQLAEGLIRLEKGIKPEFLQKRDAIVAKLSLLSKKISQTAGKKNEEKLDKLKKEYQKVEQEFDDLLIKIRLNNPLYASVRYPEPIAVQDIQQRVLKKNELMMWYFISWKKVYVFLISKKDFQVVTLGVTVNDINKFTNRYLLSTKPKDGEKLIKYGKKLYQSIFKPLESELKGKRDIIIVPDGKLALVPFESFVIDNTNPDKPVYLLEEYRIKYIQSASVLETLRKFYKRESKTNHFIGFGDPVYDYKNFKAREPEKESIDEVKGNEIKEIHRGKYNREGGKLVRLKDSGEEVKAIAGLFKKHSQKAMMYLRENATEKNAKVIDMKDYDYIHFSCHGILGDGFQSLVLSQIPGAKEDGYLTLNEIMNCDYNAKLVVLSACKTGSGKMERAEGVIGLTRAVMYAGTPAVVASLWNVSDIGTKELLVKFYTNILEKGMKKEEALRQAKLAMIKEGKYASPYFWSAFVMYGE